MNSKLTLDTISWFISHQGLYEFSSSLKVEIFKKVVHLFAVGAPFSKSKYDWGNIIEFKIPHEYKEEINLTFCTVIRIMFFSGMFGSLYIPQKRQIIIQVSSGLYKI